MTLLVGTLYDISLGIHMTSGIILLLLSVALVIFTVLGRKDDAKLTAALKFSRAFGPFAGLILITGVFQIIDGGFKFFQAWLIAGILLAFGAMGTLDGSWKPTVEKILNGDGDGDKLRQTAVGLATAVLIMFVVAYTLMENQPG